MGRTRQSINAGSRITRVLLQIVDKPSVKPDELARIAGTVCDTKEQMQGLMGAMVDRGYIERVHTVVVTDEAREVVAKLRARA